MSSLNSLTSADFVDRSLPRHSTNASRRSRTASRASSFRLSVIAEDADQRPLPSPRSPPRAHHRPFSPSFWGEPPRYSTSSHPPPKYTLWDVAGPKAEKLEDLRNNAYVAKRGGWKRICVITLLVIACLVALVVGLTVGLPKNQGKSSPAPASPSPSSSPSTARFPAGSYTLTTFLDTTSTNCTSNPASWKCEPSVTYADSPINAVATFNWIITASDSGSEPSSNFTISSTDNPFAINFSNATLNLLGAGTDQERYSFKTTVQKVVYPAFNVKCFYNDTLFTANMYTRKPRSCPANLTGASATSSAAGAAATKVAVSEAFADWNYAAEATQSIGGDIDVPACYYMQNGQRGGRVTTGYSVRPAGDFCSCAYKNYDPTG